MKNFLSQVKIVPTALGFGAVVLVVLFWLQEPEHPHITELSTAAAGAAGVLLTMGLFADRRWTEKSLYLSVFTFTTGLTWALSTTGSELMGACAVLSLANLIGVALTPYKRFVSSQQL